MRIDFDDGGYIELKRSSNKIHIIIGAKDFSKPTDMIINLAEVNFEEFSKLVESIDISPPKKKRVTRKKNTKKTSKKPANKPVEKTGKTTIK